MVLYPHFSKILDFSKNHTLLTTIDLTDEQKLLFEKLRVWRKEKADELGYPPYLIAKDVQLAEMIKLKIRTKTGFDLIKGFGKKRIEKYGEKIIAFIKEFYQDE